MFPIVLVSYSRCFGIFVMFATECCLESTQIKPCLHLTFSNNGMLLFSVVLIATGWITDRMGDDPFSQLFIDTILNNIRPLLNNRLKILTLKQGLNHGVHCVAQNVSSYHRSYWLDTINYIIFCPRLFLWFRKFPQTWLFKVFFYGFFKCDYFQLKTNDHGQIRDSSLGASPALKRERKPYILQKIPKKIM